MAGINNIKMKPKLIGAFLLTGLIPLAIIAIMSINKAGTALDTVAFNQLNSVQQIKKTQIQAHFDAMNADIAMYSSNSAVVQASQRFISAFEQEGLGGETWSKWDSFHGWKMKEFSDSYGYYDLFIISPAGDIVFTAAKESDLGQNLLRGTLSNSSLAKAFKKGQREISLVDFEMYEVSGEPASFISGPIIDANDELVGVLAFQLSLESINEVMQERAGMGETGETYLVGADKRMRSDSFLDPTGHSVVASFAGTIQNNGVDTKAATEGISGKSGSEVIADYNGNLVLSSYSPIELPGGIQWVIIAEIDMAEVDMPINSLRNTVIISALIIALVIAIFAFWIATSIANPLQRITSVAKSIAVGDLSDEVKFVQADEIGQLADAFRSMNDALKTKAEITEQLSIGNLEVSIEKASDEDLLGESLISLKSNLNQVSSEINHLVSDILIGNLETKADVSKYDGEWAKIVQGLNDITKGVSTPLRDIGDVLSKLADQDMTVRVTNEYKGLYDQLKEDVNDLGQKLGDALSQVGSAVEQIGSASNQIASGSQSLAEGTNEQSSTLEEVSSSLEEMSSMTQQNAQNAAQATVLSGEASTAANSGNESMKTMIGAIDKIKVSSDETAKIVKTIDEIAFQTNLLALNAAVEAARAGDAGKGFAVVAEEVRNLAQRSAEAAKTTAELIKESVQNAEGGVKISQEVGSQLTTIVESIGKTTNLVSEIDAASKEQAQGIEQVNTAVAEMNKVTQQNAANSEESASASEELNSQAEELNAMISEFTLNTSQRQPAASAPRQKKAAQMGAKKVARKAVASKNGNGKHKRVEVAIPLDDDDFGDF